MTDQPTTWTPERALAWLRDYFEYKGGLEPVRAIAALESAAAEIEQQKVRADGLERERDAYRKAKQENDERFMIERDEALQVVERLRAELAAVTKREADGVALFDQLLAEERAKVAKLRAELAAKQPAEAEAAQQGPSDQEIANVIESVGMCVNSLTAEALRMIARRAGVKL